MAGQVLCQIVILKLHCSIVFEIEDGFYEGFAVHGRGRVGQLVCCGHALRIRSLFVGKLLNI